MASAVETVSMRTGERETFTAKVNRKNKLELDLEYALLSGFPEQICVMRKLKVLRVRTDNIHSRPKTICQTEGTGREIFGCKFVCG